MMTVSKILTLAATACFATPVLATAPRQATQSPPLPVTAAAVPASSCGWKTVRRSNGSTALKLDREKWLSKVCDADRAQYQIVPTPVASHPNPVQIGCDYRIFTADSTAPSANAQQITDDLNRQCLAETARMREEFAAKREQYRRKQQEVDAAWGRAEQAHQSVRATQREMTAAHDDAAAAHAAKDWPAYDQKLKLYESRKGQHEIAAQTYAGLLAAYESLIASLV